MKKNLKNPVEKFRKEKRVKNHTPFPPSTKDNGTKSIPSSTTLLRQSFPLLLPSFQMTSAPMVTPNSISFQAISNH